MEEFWMMRTPERVENLPSPPTCTWPSRQKMSPIKTQIKTNHWWPRCRHSWHSIRCMTWWRIPYKLLFKEKRAGSKKQDQCALAGMLVAWQVGVEIYESQMKKITNRIQFIQTFVSDERYFRQIREIARGTVLTPDRCMTINEIKELFNQLILNSHTLEWVSNWLESELYVFKLENTYYKARKSIILKANKSLQDVVLLLKFSKR